MPWIGFPGTFNKAWSFGWGCVAGEEVGERYVQVILRDEEGVVIESRVLRTIVERKSSFKAGPKTSSWSEPVPGQRALFRKSEANTAG